MSDIRVKASWINKIDAEITRLRAENEKLREENDAWQMDGASCANEVKYLRAENKRLREALKETLAIASRNEAGGYIDRARAALEGVTEPLATLKEPDDRLNLRNAECLPSTVAVINPEPAR